MSIEKVSITGLGSGGAQMNINSQAQTELTVQSRRKREKSGHSEVSQRRGGWAGETGRRWETETSRALRWGGGKPAERPKSAAQVPPELDPNMPFQLLPAHPPTNHSKLPSSHCPALTSTACSGSAFHLQCPPQATLTKTLKAQTSLFHKATRSVLPSWLFTHSLLYSFLGLFIYVFLYLVGYILPYCPCSSFLGNFLTSLTCLFFWWIWGSLFCKNLRGCQHNLRVWIMVTLGP